MSLFLIGMFFLAASSLASLAFPHLLGELIDAKKSELNSNLLLLFFLIIAQAIFAYMRIALFVKTTAKMTADLRLDSFQKMIHLPLQFFQKKKVGELTSRIAADISLIQTTLTTDLAEFFRQIIIIIGSIVLLIITNPKLTIFIIGTLPIIMIITIFFGRYVRKLTKQVQNTVAKSNVIVEESFQAISTVKSFTNELFEGEKYKKQTKKIEKESIKVGLVTAAFYSFVIVGIFGSIILIMWYALSLNIPKGELTKFVIYAVYIGASIGGLAASYASIQKAIGATESLLEIQKEKPEKISIKKNNYKADFLNGEIKINNIYFSYPSRKNDLVLDNISINIKKGEKVAIVGMSGSGKTTLTNLLLGFFEPNKGEILFDNQKIKDIGLTKLRRHIGLVPQDIVLFGGTIRDNLLYAKTNASEKEIINATKEANAHEFILEFKKGYETIVGERGIQISGGQRQRIAIARAILKNPKILILDEATSSLDSKSERKIQESMKVLLQNKTAVIISHRLATIKNVDKIYVFDKGKIVEFGKHEELIKKDGIYKKFFDAQLKL